MEEEQLGNLKTRDFICACGKNYLSYAALFTHIKQKHDGKAPGPIVRPRSQRKRGRPRKNPHTDQDLKNSDSDSAKNGISIVNEIINNNIIFQKKAKQAAQLLGCGQFQAFQAYKPQSHSSLRLKSDRQVLKKPTLKKCTSGIEKGFKKTGKEVSQSDQNASLQLKYCKSAPSDGKAVNNDHSSYCYNFVIKQFKNMFENYQPTQQQFSCSQIIQIFDWISHEINENGATIRKNIQDSRNNLSIQLGFQLLVLELYDHLEQFKCKQIGFFLSLFYEYIAGKLNKPSNLLKIDLQFCDCIKFIDPFLRNYLPQKIFQLSTGSLHVFKQQNPTNIMLILCNWISLQEKQNNTDQKVSINHKFMVEQKMKEQGTSNTKNIENEQKQEQIKENSRCSSWQDVKFQQINDILERVKSIRQNQLKQQMQIISKSNRKKNKQQNSSQSEYQQDSQYEYPDSMSEKKMPNSKMIETHR